MTHTNKRLSPFADLAQFVQAGLTGTRMIDALNLKRDQQGKFTNDTKTAHGLGYSVVRLSD